MGRNSKCDYKELTALRDKLAKAVKDQARLDALFESCAKALAARMLALVIKRTPVGVYTKKSGKKGGTLRRGWTGGKRSAATNWADSLPVQKQGNTYVIEIINPVEYASYVEYGHRTANGKGWVHGQFMMTISAKEIEEKAPAILEKMINEYLKELFS